MLKTFPLAAAGAALILAGCGPKTLTLPDDPVEKAATCGVVAAAEARVGQPAGDVSKPLPLAAQSRILHYALLAGAASEPFSQERVAAVVNRMPAIGEQIANAKWQPLAPACTAAFPRTEVVEVTLPANALDAQLSCYTLATFLNKALAAQGEAYVGELARYGNLRRNLDTQIGSKLAAAGKATAEEQASGRAARLGAAANLGRPDKVMDACIAKYSGGARKAKLQSF